MSQSGYRPSIVSLVGAVLDDRYQILSILGEGGMGAVYRAQTPDGHLVAVKVLHEELGDNPELRERFQREIQALFALQHPNVLAAHDFGIVNGSPYLVMELLEGQSLDKFIEENPPSPENALLIMRQILTGLAFAHSMGAVHRDLKTENVFITRGPDGNYLAKLLDFGLVKFTDDQKWGSAKKLTMQGSVFGTPAYMAPEQCVGAPADARTDVYSAGCILFELLTGEWPFMEESQMGMFQAHLTRTPPTLTATRDDLAFRPELEQLLATSLQKKPQDRFPDARAMLAALDAIPWPGATTKGAAQAAAPSAVAAAQPAGGLGAPVSIAPPKKSNVGLFVGLAVVALVVLAGLFAFLK
ncbi:MAG: serine/threonine-protein kinase [Polyangiales bacterium]